MKFIHCADIHLDSPLLGLTKRPNAPASEMRLATREAFKKIIDLSLNNTVDFVVIAGDIYDVALRSYESALFFNQQMSRLNHENIPVFLVYGNHDAASKLAKNLLVPPNVKVFSTVEPEVVVNERIGIAVHGQSFATPSVAENLVLKYLPARKDLFNIGILHTNVNGDSNHDNYAPCTLDELINKGYQYWALGHVHGHQVLHTDPCIVYPGNTQGRQIREAGYKGCELVTVDPRGNVTLQKLPTSVIPWAICDVEISAASHAEDVLDLVAQKIEGIATQYPDNILALRIRLLGASNAHASFVRDEERFQAEIASRAYQTAGDQIWLEKIQIDSVPLINVDDLLDRNDPMGDVIRLLRTLGQNPTLLNEMSAELSALAGKLPAEASRPDPEYIRNRLPEVEKTLLFHLSEVQEP
jgi:DNA repair protein SbcD/Mre11